MIACTAIILYFNSETLKELTYIRIEIELLNDKLKQERIKCNENK